MSDCTPLSIITNGTVQYSTEPIASGFITNGTVATYSCADGYEVVGEVDRTCLVDGTWTGAEPNCTGIQLAYNVVVASNSGPLSLVA